MSSNALLWPSQGTKPDERFDKYKYLKLPSQGVGGVGVAAETFRIIAVFPTVADATFEFYKFYQIKNGQAPNLQINMPVVILVDLEAGSLTDLTNGFDIRVFDCEGAPIPYEVIDPIVNGDGSATFELWLNMPQVADFEFIQLAFGKDGETDGSNPNGVYDSNYKSVYHLNGVGTDSTVNAENLTLNNVTTVPAKIGTGLDFVGDDTSFAIRNPYTIWPTTEITCEFWIKTTSSAEGLLSYAVGSGVLANHFTVFRQNLIIIQFFNQSIGSDIVLNDGIFHHLVATWDSDGGLILYYLDGVERQNVTGIQSGNSFTNNGALVLAQEQDSQGGDFNGQGLDGILEEVKISNTVRDADYVKTTFNNQNDNDAFWFETPRLVANETNFLVDDAGNNIVTEITP